MVLRLSEGHIHQCEVVFHFHTGVMMDGIAPLPVKSSRVDVDLDFAHHIDVSLSREL